ncbi:MAG: hypothetical protein ACTSXZ_06770 [Alphaproteobacteria bacterium]
MKSIPAEGIEWGEEDVGRARRHARNVANHMQLNIGMVASGRGTTVNRGSGNEHAEDPCSNGR